ncbi:MAG: hypothetical protein AMXMBFR34_51120 [Myxococcaceae bacterium]
MNDIATRQLTVRLGVHTLKTAQRVARARGLTVNALIRELLLELQREEEERALAAAYEKLGADAEADVEFAAQEQARVVRRG